MVFGPLPLLLSLLQPKPRLALRRWSFGSVLLSQRIAFVGLRKQVNRLCSLLATLSDLSHELPRLRVVGCMDQ